ncbi:MAG: hypothetical protein ACJ76H_08825 [Bacteriovoracaceae bacterium]
MKLFFITGMLALSTVTAFASPRSCKIELRGPYGELINSIRTGDDSDCAKAIKSCRNWASWYYAPNGSTCQIVQDNGSAGIDYIRYPDFDQYYGYPGSPYSQVATTPMPDPDPIPSSDATRDIEDGETVISNGTLQIVVSVDGGNFYSVKPEGNDDDIIHNVSRQNMAVTRGCHAGLCATDSVINLTNSSYAAIAGIEYNGQYVIKTVDGTEALTFDVNGSFLARTTGCTKENKSKVCVGNKVLRGRGLYYTVVGIQLDGNVVIESDDEPGKLTINVNPYSLLILRQ